ncbi:hypothetical protein [Mycobacteroides abscessus]|uniref:hypothetical protein n=1 Tax=Mycobacteroides abscessus TaxID=36809 RepID=UPI0009A5DF25|nr:hypothetical protein [Mycobacteroides abscessus]MDM3950346.1 hypothetical protein [Mycobacteroides abscessus]SLJ17886.1 Uncharacterised protein [Mycobacteroides abscessus subsp. massiliense]
MSTREAWLKYAMARAAQGARVVYVCAAHESTRGAFGLAHQLAKQKPFDQWVSRIYLARGEQEIRFSTGGDVRFLDPSCHRYRGMSADVLIMEPGAETAGTALAVLGGKSLYHTHEDVPTLASGKLESR